MKYKVSFKTAKGGLINTMCKWCNFFCIGITIWAFIAFNSSKNVLCIAVCVIGMFGFIGISLVSSRNTRLETESQYNYEQQQAERELLSTGLIMLLTLIAICFVILVTIGIWTNVPK